MKKTYNLFESFPIIELDDYTLRKINDSDVHGIFEIYSDLETVKFEGMEPMGATEQAKAFIESILKGYKDKYFVRWVIERKDTKQVIGLVAMHHIDYKNANAQIGYILNKCFWRQSIMYQVLSEVITYIFNHTDIHRLEVSIHPDNIPSLNLAKKLGFQLEGLKKQCAYHQVTKSFEDRVIMGLVHNN